jgi:hypothetical protein
MSDEARAALKVSMREFEDISGITWNRRTKNIVTGHHRWENLIAAHGIENLVFKPVTKDRHSIQTREGVDTGYVLRTVDWPESKEKAANIAANAQTIAGSFTADLGTLLLGLQTDYDPALFAELRFDDLQSTVGFGFAYDSDADGAVPAHENEDEWGSNIGKVERINSENREMFDVIQVVTKLGTGAALKKIIAAAIEGHDAKIR